MNEEDIKVNGFYLHNDCVTQVISIQQMSYWDRMANAVSIPMDGPSKSYERVVTYLPYGKNDHISAINTYKQVLRDFAAKSIMRVRPKR